MIEFEESLKRTMETLKLHKNVQFYTSKQFDEAEFKISKIVRKNKISSFSVISPDSDFMIIMLIMMM